MDNPKKLATQGTQDEEKHRETGNIGYKQDEEKHRETGNIGYKQDEEKQYKNNPEKLATQGTNKTKKNNTKTIQRNWQYRVQTRRRKTIQKRYIICV